MLTVENLHAYYGKSHILQGVSFHIGEGEIVSLLGRNGVGRSTTLKAIIGDLDKVVHFVKVLGMVNSDPDFTQPPAVMNGCSDLLVEVLGEAGRHARCAVGLATLPNGMAVEVESVVEVR